MPRVARQPYGPDDTQDARALRDATRETHQTAAEEPGLLNHYPPPSKDHARAHEELRKAGKLFLAVLLDLAPASQERSAAIERIREAVMWGNAALALHCNRVDQAAAAGPASHRVEQTYAKD